MRMVANLVLTVSDLDVFFSILFMEELHDCWQYGQAFVFLFFFIVLGWFTYFWGVCYFGPKQRLRCMFLVKERMHSHPEEFRSTTVKEYKGSFILRDHRNFNSPDAKQVRVNHTFLARPEWYNTSRNATYADEVDEIRSFDEYNQLSEEHVKEFRLGMEMWGLLHVWQAVSISNARNCVDWYQGVPVVRLARYGFMAQPSPHDLAGLLNANAAYGFCVGITELFASIFMVSKYGAKTLRVIPLVLSAVSFTLCMANVIGDFPALLEEVQAEFDAHEKIKLENKVHRLNKLADIESKRRQQDQQIDAEYALKAKSNSDNPGILADKHQVAYDQARRKMSHSYEKALQAVDNEEIRLLEIQISGWRRKLQAEKDLLSGKTVVHNASANGGAVAWTRLTEKIEEWYKNEMEKLEDNVGDPGFAKSVKALEKERQKKMDAILGDNQNSSDDEDTEEQVATCSASQEPV